MLCSGQSMFTFLDSRYIFKSYQNIFRILIKNKNAASHVQPKGSHASASYILTSSYFPGVKGVQTLKKNIRIAFNSLK